MTLPYLDCVAAKPLWTRIGISTPGDKLGSNGVKVKSPSVKTGSLDGEAGNINWSRCGISHPRSAWERHAHSLLVSVPWCATITSPSAGSKPTYPVGRRAGCQRRRNHAAECERPGRRVPGSERRRDAQNWVTAPSPPDATGMNVGFAAQLAPQFHASVVEG